MLSCKRVFLPSAEHEAQRYRSPALQGVELLDLPEGILQEIARPFTLAEWVRGPAQACRLLHRMKLISVDLTCPREIWVRPD